jgi:hypothetical protein
VHAKEKIATSIAFVSDQLARRTVVCDLKMYDSLYFPSPAEWQGSIAAIGDQIESVVRSYSGSLDGEGQELLVKALLFAVERAVRDILSDKKFGRVTSLTDIATCRLRADASELERRFKSVLGSRRIDFVGGDKVV